ncbi:MBL fold metallo-hydrolase [Fodinisporobacter ferrooxydans]|uniref:MBL fold metallo-hydrolase n=1 Tax=Fodinisporobacter ferrooxydans TaxID=2901836 RepID=UPI003D314CD2
MRFSILASGSSGNCIYVSTEQSSVLLDAGVSGKQIQSALEEIAVSGSDLDAILVTHEHQDHIKGVGVVARKFALPVYATEGTWSEMDSQIGQIPLERKRIVAAEEILEFGDLKIQPFRISHDSKEPIGFCFFQGDTKLTVLTDLGFVSDRILEIIQDSNAYILEANHDTEMLRVGPYPWSLKRRILGDKGHLSNQSAGEALVELANNQLTDVYLAHLSQDNNTPELAEITVQSVLQQNRIETYRLHKTYRNRPTTLQVLGQAESLQK